MIPYLIYLLLLGGHQVITREPTMILGAPLNLTALVVLAVALYKPEVVALWFGFAAGLVVAAIEPDVMGYYAVATAVLGVIGFHVKQRLNLDSFYSKLVVVFAGVLVHNVFSMLILQPSGLLPRFWSSVLLSAVYTTVVSIVFFLLREGIVTKDRVKAIF
jgi:rod shape-determining protein MreD